MATLTLCLRKCMLHHLLDNRQTKLFLLNGILRMVGLHGCSSALKIRAFRRSIVTD